MAYEFTFTPRFQKHFKGLTQKKSQHYTMAKKWQQKKPDSKSVVYYQAVTAGIRNATRSRFVFRLTLTCPHLHPCDLLRLFPG